MNGSDPVTEFAHPGECRIGSERTAGHGRKSTVSLTADDKKDKKSGAWVAIPDGRPAGWYRDYRSAMIRRSPTFSGGEQTRSPRKTPPESAFNATQGGRGAELKAQYNRQAAYARRYVNKWPQATAHEYLTRKDSGCTGVRVNNKMNWLFPSVTTAIRSYQRIPVGGKGCPHPERFRENR